MANLGMNFDANKYEPQGVGGGQLPVSDKNGWPVVISDSEMKENTAKTGGYLELTLTVIEGEHAGQSGSYRLNLFHSNEQTVNIAYKQMSAICHVTGVFNVSDSAQLHNKPFRAVVGLQKVKPGEEDKGYTEIKGVLDINGNQPGKTGTAAPSAPPAPPQPPAPPAAAAPPAWTPPAPPEQPTAAPAPPAWGQPAGATAAPAPPPWATKPA